MISSVRFNTFAKISQIRGTRDFGLSRAPGLHHEQLIEWRRIESGRALTLGGDLFFDNWCGRALSYSFSTHPSIWTETATPNNIAFPSKFTNQLLADEQLVTLKNGTLQLLDEVGVHFPSHWALEIFSDHGAKVDIQRQTLKHIRDYRISPLLHPKPADGRPLSPREAALTEYKFIESTHHPEPLQKEVIAELDQVLASADKDKAFAHLSK